ncbi:MAG: hypothetical protein MT490_18975 [Sphingomonas sp.]|uniref:hypothetical protein n=1 Tax=Sphingomonas sp. TaxID=28214 RepID=UPI002275A15E|nr:hypothetical protein [Sphingomonas sp.]MCX8477876.1 hypothetical protein [Sphingomonas sp.]
MAARRWWRSSAAALAIGAAAPALAQTRIPVPGAPDVQLMLIPVPEGADVDSVLPGVIEKVGAGQGGIGRHAKPTQVNMRGTPMRIEAVSFNSAPGVAFFFLSVPRGRAICMAAIPLGQEKKAAMPTGEACLSAMGTGAAPAGTAAAGSPPPAPAAPAAPAARGAPPAHGGNWARVADVYFRSVGGFGVGGMVTLNFEPIVLFKDGSYYEIDDAALEDVDLAAERARRPDDWGRWSRQGDRFVLTDSKGRANDYALQQGRFFKAYPAAGAAALSGSYETVGGGGNTAFGGEVMIATNNRYNFLAGGVFTTARSTGATNSGAMTGVASSVAAKRAGQGRFAVDRHTITFTHPDGRSERRFFAFGSRKTPPQIDRGMLFIGDTVYTLDD